MTEIRKDRTEDRYQERKDRGQIPGKRGQRTDIRKESTEDRYQ